MVSSSPAEKPPRPISSSSSSTTSTLTTRIVYLSVYNLVFAGLWGAVLVQTLRNLVSGSGSENGIGKKENEFQEIEPLARWIQTASLIEIGHAGVGLIKSPISTTATQILTRVIQVWLVWFCFPASTASSWAFTALVLAWSIADCIRYAYLMMHLHGVAPGWLVWLRYTMFYPLYPVGIGAEWWLMYLTVEPGRRVSGVYPAVIYFLLVLYFYGAFKMFTYMVKQRKKTLGARSKIA